MAVAFVAGVQSRGRDASIKHFVANDSEHERYTISSDVDDRTLRELYLRPFHAAVTEAGVWAVMTAYNGLNGTPCSANSWLLTDLLKGEWGFDGLVVSDWMGTYETEGPALAGLDIEMPGPGRWLGHRLADAIAGRPPTCNRAGRQGDAVAPGRRVGRRRQLARRVSKCGEDDPALRTLIRRAGRGPDGVAAQRSRPQWSGWRSGWSFSRRGATVAFAPGSGQYGRSDRPACRAGHDHGRGLVPGPIPRGQPPVGRLRARLGEAGVKVVYEPGCRIDRYAPEICARPTVSPCRSTSQGRRVGGPAGTVRRIAVGLTGDGSEPSPARRGVGRVR